MDFMHLLDIVLHVDKALGTLITEYGTMAYAFLFGIVFAETGLVVFPFLPGDTLLFFAGTFSAAGAMNVWLLIFLLITAAVTGNTVNYLIGQSLGHKVFTHDYKWLDKAALQKTHAFFERHGGKTIILCRFVPLVRTFAPFVAGVSEMSFARFQLYNFIGAIVWVAGLVAAGYFFGSNEFIQRHLNTIVLVGVGAAVGPLLLSGVWKLGRKLFRQKQT